MKAAKIGPGLGLLSGGLYLLYEPQTKNTPKNCMLLRLLEKQPTFVLHFLKMKTAGGRYLTEGCMGIFQRLDKFPRLPAMKECDSH